MTTAKVTTAIQSALAGRKQLRKWRVALENGQLAIIIDGIGALCAYPSDPELHATACRWAAGQIAGDYGPAYGQAKLRADGRWETQYRDVATGAYRFTIPNWNTTAPRNAGVKWTAPAV